MSKLPGFLKDSTLEGYTHLLAATNLDFVPVLYIHMYPPPHMTHVSSSSYDTLTSTLYRYCIYPIYTTIWIRSLILISTMNWFSLFLSLSLSFSLSFSLYLSLSHSHSLSHFLALPLLPSSLSPLSFSLSLAMC